MKILAVSLAVLFVAGFCLFPVNVQAAENVPSYDGYDVLFYDPEFLSIYVQAGLIEYEVPQVFVLDVANASIACITSIEITIENDGIHVVSGFASMRVSGTIEELGNRIAGFRDFIPAEGIFSVIPLEGRYTIFCNSLVGIDVTETYESELIPYPGITIDSGTSVLPSVGQAVQGVIGWVGQVVPTITEYPGFIMMIAVPLCVGIVTWVTTIYKRRRG